MTTTETTKPRGRTLLFALTGDQLLPLDLGGVPEPIAKANEEAHAAVAQAKEAEVKARELREQAKAAPKFDSMAAEAAFAAGETPPKPTVEAKEKKADEAKRLADAAERHAKQMVRYLYDAREQHGEPYVAARREAFETAQAELEDLVPGMLDKLITYERERALYRTAERWHNNPTSARLGGTRHNKVQRKYDRAKQRLSKPVPHNQVPNELGDLLAALAVKLERGEV